MLVAGLALLVADVSAGAGEPAAKTPPNVTVTKVRPLFRVVTVRQPCAVCVIAAAG